MVEKVLENLVRSFVFTLVMNILFEVTAGLFLSKFIGLAALTGFFVVVINLMLLLVISLSTIIRSLRGKRLEYVYHAPYGFRSIDYIYALFKLSAKDFAERVFRGLVEGSVFFVALIYINYIFGTSVICLNIYKSSGLCFSSIRDYVYIPFVFTSGIFVYRVFLSRKV